MAIGVRVQNSGSWLDPNCAGLLGWKLGQKLWRRCRGKIGVFLTLTYRRDEYSSAQDLYYRQRERQDVPLFIRRLSRLLGVSLKGKWLCKAEFQSGGWIHFHIVLVDVGRIEHADLVRLWGHGWPWIKKLTRARCLYICKYVAKGGRIPLWLYGEPPRSVKIVRTSPGFWPAEDRRPTRQGADVALWADGTPVTGGKVAGCYVPVGIRLRRRGVLVNYDGKVFSRRCEPSQFMLQCLRYALRVWQSDGWIWYEIPGRGLEWILGGDVAARERPPSESGHASPPTGGLHLSGSSNPDALRRSIMQHHWYIEAEMIEEGLAA